MNEMSQIRPESQEFKLEFLCGIQREAKIYEIQILHIVIIKSIAPFQAYKIVLFTTFHQSRTVNLYRSTKRARIMPN